jgi:hypothetical protein
MIAATSSDGITMRISFCVAAILLVSLGAGAFPDNPRSSEWILARIDRPLISGIPDEVARTFQVLQELSSCWIAKSSNADFEVLLQSGGSGAIIDEMPEGKTFYLFSGVAPEQIPAIEPLGHATTIEDGIILFWSESEDFWDLIPEQIHIKALSSETRLRITSDDGEVQEGRRTLGADDLELANPSISNMVAAISRDALSSSIQDLQDFQTRRITTSNCESAGTYIYNSFASRGYAPEYDSFSFSYQGTSWTTRNIIATVPGKSAPEQIVIIGAHYDSTSNQPLILAPGADDNASGTAAVLEIARIMRDQPFDFSVRFICFSAEEIGLVGSRHYAQTAAAAGESIVGMISLDMIGYAARTGEDLNVIANNTSGWLADLFLSAAGTYTTLPVLTSIQPSVTGSDHSSFWDQGFSAVLAIESYPLVNPYYHKTTDTLDKLDMDFAASATKAALATVAVLAQPVSTPLAPAGVSARAETVRSLFRRFKNIVLSWSANDATATGYNLYRSSEKGSSFSRINTTPIQGTDYVDRYLQPDRTFYYVVTAVDGQARESAYSKQVSR